MKKLLAALAIALSLAGCGDDSGTPEPTTSVTSSTTTTPAAAQSEPAAAERIPADVTNPQACPNGVVTNGVDPPYCAAPGEKTIASCGDSGMYDRGTTFYTDGTSGWTQYCADQYTPPPPPPTWDQNSDTWTDTNGDGVMQGNERCGIACGDAPTSGEIQGCNAGTIDPAICQRAGL